ncbi:3-oxoacyl-reductase [Aspergillus sclerotiicarbonarius CBS 121057]|uniref:3-oxoacyl-reductase n=1 Tax=Aspergillus sclerotiicarbonarius (strain CBS 121057 / IBT 28362) TaxID=1448318 RepID=A0A319E8J4_ASPSB|nr:3-oxoacyl-reductase [Aspergillus sclerotiicarbonarius CBS 121057]
MSPMQGKVFAITGAASGMGYAIAQHLATQGARVSITDVSREGLEKSSNELKALTGTENVLSYTQSATSDGAVNAAGIHPRESGKEPIWNVTDSDWDFAQDVNVRGTLNVVRAALRHMASAVSRNEMQTGSIIVFGSNSSITGNANLSAYTTSKHAVLGLMRSAAMDAAPYNIRVNAICPGPIDTPMLRNAVPEEQLGAMAASIPLKRLGTSKEVTGLVTFLLDEYSGFCTGGVYMVDGGMTSC